IRWASLALLLLSAVGLVIWPLLRKRSDELIAIHVERRYPAFGERLLSTVEFEQANGVVPGTSESMVRALATETAAMADGVRFETAFSARGLMRSGILFLAVLAAWVVQMV